jgi:phosphosulfolactate synthase (CoM biosynthesis protein A)
MGRSVIKGGSIMAEITGPDAMRAFSFIRLNQRQQKPRESGLTEIRGPYYPPMGRRYLDDLFETVGEYIDSLKFAGGSFTLMPRMAVQGIIDKCHEYNILVSIGGFIEHVLTQGPEIVEKYISECNDLGFDIIEVSTGFITIPVDDWLRLIEKVQKAGLKAKPEIGIQFGAGGASAIEQLEAEGTHDPG